MIIRKWRTDGGNGAFRFDPFLYIAQAGTDLRFDARVLANGDALFSFLGHVIISQATLDTFLRYPPAASFSLGQTNSILLIHDANASIICRPNPAILQISASPPK